MRRLTRALATAVYTVHVLMLWFKIFQSNPVLIFLRLINIPYHNLKQRKIKIEIVFKKTIQPGQNLNL